MTHRAAVDALPPPAGLSAYAGHRGRLAGFRGSIPVTLGMSGYKF